MYTHLCMCLAFCRKKVPAIEMRVNVLFQVSILPDNVQKTWFLQVMFRCRNWCSLFWSCASNIRYFWVITSAIDISLCETDMDAFKAANPGANLEDFVQSQSLQHRIDPSVCASSHSDAASENIAGTSEMREMADLTSEPGMWWRQMWDSKRAQMKDVQKPPFDHIREAEKVNIFRLRGKPLNGYELYLLLVPWWSPWSRFTTMIRKSSMFQSNFLVFSGIALFRHY